MTDEYVLMDDHARTGSSLVHRTTGALFNPPQGWAIKPQKDQPGGQHAGGRFRGQILRPAAIDPEPKGLAYQMETDGLYCSIDEVLPNGLTMFDLVNKHYRAGDPGYQYHYAWAHKATELAGERPDVWAAFNERLEKALSPVPFKFTLLGARRRYLLYFSPGNQSTQTSYLTLAPRPQLEPPFNAEGKLSSRYRDHFPPAVVEELAKTKGANVWPQAWNGLSPHPLLYRGPAWSIRFLLDDQDVLSGNRIWITDDMNFISSDWCQRHNYSTYHSGMDFHNQEFDFATWITVALVKKAIRDRMFKPKSAEIKHYAVRDAMNAAKGGAAQYGEWLKAARDCLLQLEFMGSYEIPTVYGMPFDPLTLTFKAPLTKKIVRSDALPIEATLPEGTEVEWQFAGLGSGNGYVHIYGPKANVVWASYKQFSANGPYTEEPYVSFLTQFNKEVQSYLNARGGHTNLYATVERVASTVWERSVKMVTNERSTDPKKKPLAKSLTDLREVWRPVFVSATGSVATPTLVLAGIDERDLRTGRTDPNPQAFEPPLRQAGVDENDLDVDDGDDWSDEDEDDNDDGEILYDEALAEAIDAHIPAPPI